MHETTHLSYMDGTVNITLDSESLTEIAAPAYRFDDYNSLVEACLTKKELDAVSGGATADLNVYCTITDDIADDVLKTQFSKAIEKEERDLGQLTEGMYIDLSAVKSTAGGAQELISNLSEDVTLVIDVPLYLISEDRSYWIMISNMGEFVLLPDIDNEPDTITISAHNLTTGLLLYQDPLDSLQSSQSESFTLKGRHFLLGGIIILLFAWFILTRLHKNDV